MSPGDGVRVGVLDLLRLGARLAAARVGVGKDPAGAGCRWARARLAKGEGTTLGVSVPGLSVRIVGDRAISDRILAGRPDSGGPAAGSMKTKAMEVLAPRALTIADGEDWARLRAFNERVLESGGAHRHRDAFLVAVRKAFESPVRNAEDVRSAMGRAMVEIVLGGAYGGTPAADAHALFGLVQSPVRRALPAFLHAGRKRRLRDVLMRALDDTEHDGRTLISRARGEADGLTRDELLDQIPHWMFTFTGSGTDLLVRTLAMIGARPNVHARAEEEIRNAGAPDDPETPSRLPYLEACLRETGRLFPPVTRTFHRLDDPIGGEPPSAETAETGRRASQRTSLERPDRGEGMETVHYFPLLQRDPELDASIDAFRPDRWLEPEPDPAVRASNLFLRGPRACPGEDLILFVCKAALARQVGEIGITVRPSRLGHDPLPVTFPAGEARFLRQGDA